MLLLTLTASAQCPDTGTWPGETWSEAAPNEEQAALLAELAGYAFATPERNADGEIYRTNSVVVIHRGELLFEQYARGFDADMRHVGWSVTKSALSLMVGIAEKAGEIALSDTICDHLDIARTENCGITVEQMLTFTTSLRWTETYADQPPTVSSVANMLFGAGRLDAAAFVAGHPPLGEPGTVYDYSSGDSVLLSAVLTAAVEDRWGADFIWDQLFTPLGMSSAQISRDRAGTLLGSSGMAATPRDYARMGYLALREGCWEGEMLVADDWMARTTTVAPRYLTSENKWDGHARPGLSWWLNTVEPADAPPWEGVPPSAYAALGHQGQMVYVVPTHDLVVVRTGFDEGRALDRARFLRMAMAVADAAPPLPEPIEEAPAEPESPTEDAQ